MIQQGFLEIKNMNDKVTLAELGQKFKTKYPGSYDSIDDEQLGTRVLEKFPEYKDRIKPVEEEPGFLKGLGQAIAKPVIRTAGTIATAIGAAGAEIIPGGESGADVVERVDREGIDYGVLGNAKPFGASARTDERAGKISADDSLTRTVRDAAGTGAELVSYALAPLKGAAGFWGAIKASAPIAATLGLGKALQASGEGKGAGEAAGEGLMNAAGATAGFYLIPKAGQFIANWGARALQSQAARAAATVVRDAAENVWSAVPQAFKDGAKKTITELTTENPSVRRTVAVLQRQFDKDWKIASDATIDAVMPTVKDPDLAFGSFQRTLGEEMGGAFRSANKLYDDVKASDTRIKDWGGIPQKISDTITNLGKKIVSSVTGGGKAGASSENIYAQLSNLEQRMKGESGISLKEVMIEWEQLMQHVPSADKETAAAVREVAASLYSGARKTLQTQDPDLLNQWDLAYQSWKKATDVYESNILGTLKSSGDVDTFVDKMLSKALTRPEQTALNKALAGEGGEAAQDLLVNSILRKAKAEKTAPEGAKIINEFLDNWESTLTPEQAKFLDDTAGFMDGKFEDFVNGMREAQGIMPDGKTVNVAETAAKLQTDKAKIDVLNLANEGKFDEVVKRFTTLAESSPDELASQMKLFTPEEKQGIGAALSRDLLKEESLLAARNPDGSYSMDKKYVQKVFDVWNKVSTMPEDVASQLFTSQQLNALEDAVKAAQTAEDLSNVEFSALKRFAKGAVGFFYALKGWAPGAFRNATEAFSGEGKLATKAYDEINSLIDKGLLEKNTRMKVGDFFKGLGSKAAKAIPKIGGEIGDQATED